MDREADLQRQDQLRRELEIGLGQREDILDRLLVEAEAIGAADKDINETVGVQRGLIAKLGNRTQNLTKDMRTANTRLESVAENANYACLYITILIEIIFMVVLVAYL